jgi:hypothetical protein
MMPRYFFHINHAGHRVEDPEGADFDDLETAEQEVAATLRELIAAALIAGEPSTLQSIDVADNSGLVCASVDFMGAMQPVFDFTNVPLLRGS